jgi:branched-chain amino acid transport system ATP-binding protein
LTAPVLELRGVHAGYGRARILEDVSMSVGVGECVALLGRNGAGKSTLCGSIYGIAQITAGVVEIEGRRLDGRHLFQAAQLGVALVPQGRRILANLTVRENLLLGAAPRRTGPWNLDSVFQLFPVLAERAGSAGTALSGGQLQMLAIGRALMSNPRLLVLDEPTEGLSPIIVEDLLQVLKPLPGQGTALLLVEQSFSVVRRLADRFLVLEKGRVVAQAGIDRLTDQLLHQHLAV